MTKTVVAALEGPLRREVCTGHTPEHAHDACAYMYEDGLREVCWNEDYKRARG